MAILLDILKTCKDIQMIKFAINYLKSLTNDETFLKLLKDYLDSIMELVFKYLLFEDQQIIVSPF